MSISYETVIGLEVHVELATKTKLFCGCSTEFGKAPNTHTCPVCTGMPGSLPVLNKQVLKFAAAVGLATGGSVARRSRFDRKNYFYPDNPQNYQISQLYLPICTDGRLEIETREGIKTVRIHEIHMEEDAGKLLHDEWEGCSLVDYNRSGVPLLEIVTEPDMRSAEEAVAFLKTLRERITYLGASDCRLEEGSMRADVNLSVRREGEKELGTRTEMKNLNSFRAIERAIAGERERQTDLLNKGLSVVQETRRWDDMEGESYPMRGKEDAKDYRYFPDPDLAPVEIDGEWLAQIKKEQPEFRPEKRLRYKKEYGLPDYDIDLLTGSKCMADLFEQTAALCGQPKKVSNWLMGETLRLLKEREQEPEDLRVTPEHLARLIGLLDEGVINGSVAREVFAVMFDTDTDPERYVGEKGLKTVSDAGALKKTAEEVIAQNPQSVADYRGGKERAIGFLVGQTMKAMKGKADPAAVNRMLKELIEK